MTKGGAAVKRAAKKCILLLAGLALAAILSGCTVFDSSVEQLFTLPRMAPEYTGLSRQLDSLIAQGYETRPPPAGGTSSPCRWWIWRTTDGRRRWCSCAAAPTKSP